MRFYLISGLSHGVGDITDRGVCQQFTNAVSPYPVHRSFLVTLDEWVSHGTPPPKSLVPRHSDKSASAVPRPGFQTGVVPPAALEWPAIPGVTFSGLITTRYFLDWGPMFDDGIVSTSRLMDVPPIHLRVAVDQDNRWPASACLGVARRSRRPPLGTGAPAASDGCESVAQHSLQDDQGGAHRRRGPRSLIEGATSHDGYVAVTKAAQGGPEAGGSSARRRRCSSEAKASNVLKKAFRRGRAGSILPTSFVSNSGIRPRTSPSSPESAHLTDSRGTRDLHPAIVR